ncbi:MAG: FAD-dependent monooxygenase [Myxococcales bacterium]
MDAHHAGGPGSRAQPRAATHYDVIIVGGGVAGGTAAKFLSEAGKRALVLEAGEMPRWSETCSGIFGETFRILERKPEDYPGELLVQDDQKIRLFFGGRTYGALPKRWTKPLFDETLYFALRGELEAWISSQSDATVLPRARVRSQDIQYTAGTQPRYRVRAGATNLHERLLDRGGWNPLPRAARVLPAAVSALRPRGVARSRGTREPQWWLDAQLLLLR